MQILEQVKIEILLLNQSQTKFDYNPLFLKKTSQSFIDFLEKEVSCDGKEPNLFVYRNVKKLCTTMNGLFITFYTL